MQVTFIPPRPCDSLTKRLPQAQCPVMDLRIGTFSRAQILEFLIEIAAFFFDCDAALIHADTNVDEELVMRFYAHHGKDPDRTDATGIPASAITGLLFVLVVEDALGLEVSGPDADYDLETIGGLLTYIELALRSVGKIVDISPSDPGAG